MQIEQTSWKTNEMIPQSDLRSSGTTSVATDNNGQSSKHGKALLSGLFNERCLIEVRLLESMLQIG